MKSLPTIDVQETSIYEYAIARSRMAIAHNEKKTNTSSSYLDDVNSVDSQLIHHLQTGSTDKNVFG